MTAIGIDLGTTYSCVAVYQHGKVEIIANEIGERTTPSWVSFTNTERLIGKAAKSRAVVNPENTVHSVKRLIGRRITDQSVVRDKKNWSFKVSHDNSIPKIEVTYKNERKVYSPEEISAMILTKMKQVAETYLGVNVKDAVVTVPAYFNNSQRQSTKDAAKIAGLNLLRIINEPTAASIAYGFDKEIKNNLNILVFDLGGGTLDVSVMCIRNGIYEVKATSGDTHLGGEDFTNRLVEYFVKKFSQLHGEDISGEKKPLMRMLNRCEEAKRSLSGLMETTLELDMLYKGIDFNPSITRSYFEDLNADLFISTLKPIQEALKDARMEKDEIDEIVLVGGSTRIPKIKELIQEYFNGKIPNQSINPDEAVAYGAAVQAAILSRDESQKIEKLTLLDVTPLSLGTRVRDNEMSIIIKRNTPVPTEQKQTYVTASDNQTRMRVDVYEGEHQITSENNLLGTFTLNGVTPAPSGATKMEVTFHLEVDGILEVSAVELGTGKQKNMTIAMDIGRLSETEIARMVTDAERLRIDDEKERKRVGAKFYLMEYTYHVRKTLEDAGVKNTISNDDYQIVSNEYNRVSAWLKDNQNADEAEFIRRKQMLERTCTQINQNFQRAD